MSKRGHEATERSTDAEDCQPPAKKVKQQRDNDRPPQASLLGLPGELRNKIYRLAIVDSDRITIDAAHPTSPQPGLLRTCRQLRRETIDIFYHENYFRYMVGVLKVPVPPDHSRLRASKHSLHYAGLSTDTHAFNWQNPLQWLKDYHDQRAHASFHKHSTKMVKALDGALKIVQRPMKNGKVSWKEIETVPEAWKDSIGVVGGAVQWV